jgi:hypothetical protein
MALTCPESGSLVDSELNQLYGDGKALSLLPATQIPASDRESSGALTAQAIQTLVANLKNTGVVPTTNGKTEASADAFQKKQAALLQSVKSEYCFYYSRYKYALIKLLEAIRQGYANSTPDKKQTVEKYLAFTQLFNQKLNDLVQIMDAVTRDMLANTTSMESEIKKVNQTLQEQKDKLAHQHKVIASNEAAKKLNREMVHYTEEKARYTDNLLTLYSALNIVALGLLVYVYKSYAD